MNRRDLLKSMVVAPLLSVLPARVSAFGGNCNTFKFGSLNIVLEGPFGVVYLKDPASGKFRIRAFVPQDDTNEHQFVFNGVAQDTSKNYHFTLSSQTGLTDPAQLPYEDPGLMDFKFKSRFNDSNDYFITIDLTDPDGITLVHQPEQIVFADNTPGNLPLNHILVYGVQFQNAGIEMTSTELGDLCAQDVDIFSFEVGLANGTPVDYARAHAKDFYNKKLFPHFQDIPPGKQIGQYNVPNISAKSSGGVSKGSKTGKPRIKHFKHTKERISFWPNTTAVECKSGGLLVDAT